MTTTTRMMQSVHVAEDQMDVTRRSTPGRVVVPCEVYSRVVGYLRPIQNWNQGKQQEFSERRPFRVPEAVTRSDTE